MPEQEYNKLFLEQVFMKNPLMNKYLPDVELITTFNHEYLKKIEEKVEPKRDLSKIRSGDATIDYENPQVLLVTSFSCFEERTQEN
jgi:hypothetical protein